MVLRLVTATLKKEAVAAVPQDRFRAGILAKGRGSSKGIRWAQRTAWDRRLANTIRILREFNWMGKKKFIRMPGN
jgi:hypothetical protein